MKALRLDKFAINPEVRGMQLNLQWQGEIALRAPTDAILPYLTEVLKEQRSTTVVLNFTGVTFMNSSALIPVIAFLKRANEQNIRCVIAYNREVGWQRVSHNSMGVMFKNNKNIRVMFADEM